MAGKKGSLPALLTARRLVCLVCISEYVEPLYWRKQFVAPIYCPRTSLFLSSGLHLPCWADWNDFALPQFSSNREPTQYRTWGWCQEAWADTLTWRRMTHACNMDSLINVWWQLPSAGQCSFLRDLSFIVSLRRMCAWEPSSPAPSWKKVFLNKSLDQWLNHGITSFELIGRRFDGGMGWDFENGLALYSEGWETWPRPTGRLVGTEGHVLTLQQRWAKRSLPAKPRCSSRNRSESVNLFASWGGKTWCIPYKPKNKCLQKVLRKLKPFGRQRKRFKNQGQGRKMPATRKLTQDE